MDRKYRKTDRERVVKDRGDLKKNFDVKKVEEPLLVQNFEDRGDSRTLDIVLHLDDDKKCSTTQTPSMPLRRPEPRAPVNLLSNVEGRRLLAERYTIRRRVSEGKDRYPENKARSKVGIPQKPIPIEAAKELAQECGLRNRDLIKPVLKILSRDDTVKLSKAVTFNFSNKQLQTKKGRLFRKPSSIKTLQSRKIKPRYKTRVRASSPTLARASPPTEVAKWAPSCLKHAKPYYEAWVDTTLAAISKEKRKLGEQELRTLTKKRPSTPEFMYGDVNDEKFTGRIRVKI